MVKIHGATTPKSQDRLKWLLPDGSRGGLVVSKALSLNLNFSFLNWIPLLLIQVATQLSSRGWVDPIPDPILPEKFLGYSQESNPGPLGWQSAERANHYTKQVINFNGCREKIRIISISMVKIHGATTPKSQDRLKWLLPDGSRGGLVVSKALIPQP